MSLFRKVGEPTKYHFVNERCIGRRCWAPGRYQHRSPMAIGGSRNTGSPDTPCCLNNAYHGCQPGPDGQINEPCTVCGGTGDFMTEAGFIDPKADCEACRGYGYVIRQGLPEFDKDKAAERKADGWRKTA